MFAETAFQDRPLIERYRYLSTYPENDVIFDICLRIDHRIRDRMMIDFLIESSLSRN
jgi:hypothetical protein